MNYYEHHIGDFDADTAHLSMLEDAAYSRLMRLYYRKEAPIPADVSVACRLIRAASKQEREAVEAVLNEFFTLDADGWHQGRCDRDIERFKAKAERNREVGKLGGRPLKTKTQIKPTNNHGGFSEEPTRNPPQTPCTKPQSPDTSTGADAPAAQAGATPGASVTLALKAHGIGGVGPSHPRLTALLAAGATVEEFTAFAAKALDAAPARAFEYVLGCVEGERQRAKDTAAKLHRGPMPVAQSKQAALEARNAATVAKLKESLNAA